MIDQYGVEGFAIVDDNFIVNKNKVGDICDQIQDLGSRWSALSRVDTIDGRDSQDGEFWVYRSEVRHRIGERAPAQGDAKEHQQEQIKWAMIWSTLVLKRRC